MRYSVTIQVGFLLFLNAFFRIKYDVLSFHFYSIPSHMLSRLSWITYTIASFFPFHCLFKVWTLQKICTHMCRYAIVKHCTQLWIPIESFVTFSSKLGGIKNCCHDYSAKIKMIIQGHKRQCDKWGQSLMTFCFFFIQFFIRKSIFKWKPCCLYCRTLFPFSYTYIS